MAQAVESVLNQQTNFDVLLCLFDDASTDSTFDIASRYGTRNRVRIRCEKNLVNLGAVKNVTRMLRFALAHVSPFVAFLEGDDYWTNPSKLQTQFDFLSAHPDFNICYHNAEVVYTDGSQQSCLLVPPGQNPVSSIEDLFDGNFIPSASVMFRNRSFQDLPDWYSTSAIGDWPLHLMNAHTGKVGYLDRSMSVYRIHTGGMWSSRSELLKVSNVIDLLKKCNAYFNYKYDRQVQASLTKKYCHMSDLLEEDGSLTQASIMLTRKLKGDLAGYYRPSRGLVTRILRLQMKMKFPALYALARKFRRFVSSLKQM